MSAVSTVAALQTGVTIAATQAQLAAPIVSVFNPAAGVAMALLAPLAASFIVEAGQMVIEWRRDMTPEQMAEALNASKSANWPAPPAIDPVA